jgi:hypothetical protein
MEMWWACGRYGDAVGMWPIWRCGGHVAHMGTNKNLVGQLNGEDNLEDTAVDGYIILPSVLKLGWKILHCINFAEDRNTKELL